MLVQTNILSLEFCVDRNTILSLVLDREKGKKWGGIWEDTENCLK